MKLKPTLLILMLSSALSRLSAQSTEYQFSTVNFSNGLSNNHITSLYKDPRGFMWFGTMSGLDRYDGYEFKVFRHDQHDPHSIGDNFIEQIFEGPEGKMWVQSRSSHFNIYDLATDQFDHDYAAYLRNHHLPEFWLLGIVRNSTGYWFIYRDSGIYHLNFDGKVIAVHQDSTRPGCLSTATISDAKEDHAGNCWVFHQNGLLEKVDAHTHTVVFRTTELGKVFGHNQFPCGLYIDNQDDIWLYSSGYFKGVFCYHPHRRLHPLLYLAHPGSPRNHHTRPPLNHHTRPPRNHPTGPPLNHLHPPEQRRHLSPPSRTTRVRSGWPPTTGASTSWIRTICRSPP